MEHRKQQEDKKTRIKKTKKSDADSHKDLINNKTNAKFLRSTCEIE